MSGVLLNDPTTFTLFEKHFPERACRMATVLFAAKIQSALGVPIVIAGDLNTPSHIDWGEGMQQQRLLYHSW